MIALRLALRELRGGLAGFGVFLACLALGVAAIAAVGSMRAAIEAGLAREAATLLGGDAEIEFTYRFADAQEREWMAERAAAVSEIVDFRSMVATDAAERAGRPERALVQAKAVDDAYPLAGAVALEGGAGLAAALEPAGGLPGMVVAGLALDRLGVGVGDVLRMGTQDFRVTARLESEPDAAPGFAFGPRVIVKRAALAESGLLGPGTLFNSSYRLRLPPGADLAALKAEAEARFADRGLSWRDRRAGAPGIGRFVERLGSFLALMGLAGLAVGGVGVAAAVRSHLERKTATIAVLKTLGATGGTVFAVYFVQIGLLAALGVALGLAIGVAAPFVAAPLVAGALPAPLTPALYPRPLAEAALYGLLTAAIFTLWPLARVRDLRAAALFRDLAAAGPRWPRAPWVALSAALAAALVAAATWFAASARIALFVAVGVIGALAALWLAAAAMRALARRGAGAARGRPALRLALGAVAGPGGETAAVTMSLGLGLAVLAAVGQVDGNLRRMIAADLPERAPAFFFVDIQNDQLDGFVARAGAIPGVAAVETAPMLRGVIAKVNGRPAREAVGPHWALNGDRGVTYAAAPPEGTTLTAGEWWPADHAGPPLMSFAAGEAAEMGLKLGDAVTLNILGRDVTATIASFREVDFRDMGINFLIALNPAALAGAPHTHIATVDAGPEAEAALVRAVAGAYPNVTAISVREGVERFAEGLEGVSAATRWAAAVTLAAGIVVLIGAAAAGEGRRVHEAAVLKTLGAERGLILRSFALRAALVGAAAGAVAVAAGAAGGWWATATLLEGSFRFQPGSAAAIVAGGALASLAAGLVFALRPLAARPARTLRARG